VLLAFVQHSFGQDNINVIFSGKLSEYPASKDPYVYFTARGEKFRPADQVKINADKSYLFDLSKTRFKGKPLTEICFSLDTTANTNSEDACVHRIQVDAIRKYAASQSMSSIKVPTDLIPSFPCLASVTMMPEDDQRIFVGDYVYTNADTVSNIKLESMMYRYEASWKPYDADLMNEILGSWSYRDSTLTLHRWYRLNKAFGTLLEDNTKKEFAVKMEPMRIIALIPKNAIGVLKRL
jgi:hypothetical protein